MKTLIIGVGNLLMGDEGVGINVVRHIQKQVNLPGVDVVDGGTGGLHLLEYFQKDHDRIIIVDAANDGKQPGTITMLNPEYSHDYPRTLTAHDIGLKDLVDTMHLLEKRPEMVLFTISISSVNRVTLELSPEIKSAIEPAAEKILDYIQSHS